jgi:ABC-2 type transport system ATP-binding protein
MQDVHAGYGGRGVLHGFSLTVPAGSIHALMGANGAGKSTVTRVACGLLRPSAGRVEVSGGVRRRIGLAPQETALFPALTPRENVTAVARLHGVARTERAAEATRVLELTDCLPRGDEPVRTLSGGWRRRANLAAALVGRPPLLIVDEPTEGVDAATRSVLAGALTAAAVDGAGCLLISHDAAFVALTADRIGVLVEGRLAVEGAPEVILNETFGQARLLSVRLPRPPSGTLAETLSGQGLAAGDDGLSWRTLREDALTVAQLLATAVHAEGGELAVRRPDLSDLVDRLSERAA